MTDEAIFDFLHTELVNYTMQSKDSDNKEAKVKCYCILKINKKIIFRMKIYQFLNTLDFQQDTEL